MPTGRGPLYRRHRFPPEVISYVFSISVEPSHGRGDAGGDLRELRDRAPVGEEVRLGVLRSDPPASSGSRQIGLTGAAIFAGSRSSRKPLPHPSIPNPSLLTSAAPRVSKPLRSGARSPKWEVVNQQCEAYLLRSRFCTDCGGLPANQGLQQAQDPDGVGSR